MVLCWAILVQFKCKLKSIYCFVFFLLMFTIKLCKYKILYLQTYKLKNILCLIAILSIWMKIRVLNNNYNTII